MIEPVEWTPDGWPIAPTGAHRADPMAAPLGIGQRPMISLSDDFHTSELSPVWQSWDETDMTRFQSGNGALTIRAKGSTPGQSSPLASRPRDKSYSLQVIADVGDNECGAALGLFYNPDNWVFAELKGGRVRLSSASESLGTQAWNSDLAYLKLVNRENKVDFLASETGSDWQLLASNYDTSGYTNNKQHDYQELHAALASSGSGVGRFAKFIYQSL